MRWDAAIVGGGLAGAGAACRLAEAGRRVILFERGRGPHHKVCGEFVSVEAQAELEALGLRDRTGPPLGAVPIDHVAVIAGSLEAAAALPFSAWGLSRFRLDEWLLRQAERCGADIRRGETVRALSADTAGATLAVENGSITADAALLATGKHDLRCHRRAHRSADLIGFKMHLRLDPAQDRALDRRVEIALFKGGYAGLQRIEEGLANLCLVLSKDRFAALGRDWRRLVTAVPHLAKRLDGAAECWPRPLAIYGIPYGFQYRGESDEPVYRLGDQLAVIPSFTGDGMAIALDSARRAAAAVLDGQPAAIFHRDAREAFRAPIRAATLIALANRWPALQTGFTAACRLAPGLMTAIARRTRIAHAA